MDEFNEAVGIGLRLLHTRDRFPEEVRLALLAKGISEDTAEQAVAHLVKKGLLSETRAVDSKLCSLSGKRAKGDHAIMAELERLGASQEAIVNTMDASGDERERARQLLAAKFGSPPSLPKAARFLNSRGFSEETISSVLEDLGADPLG